MSLERKAQCTLIRGEDKNVVIRLEADGEVYNFANATDWKVLFPKEGGGAIVKTKDSLDVVPVNNGNALQARIRADESIFLRLGDNLSVEVHIVDNGYTSYAQIENALTVKQTLFPNL